MDPLTKNSDLALRFLFNEPDRLTASAAMNGIDENWIEEHRRDRSKSESMSRPSSLTRKFS
ncbi:hypothetical protein F2Q69_00005539 [Brassica cretica]|uniref:Uncharacterized protein n=1 Tax=Brassica cretica TaxID=69181 RepID=A0A8S9P4Y6_BRACR|nr:hypothetical protein F2Q69_00005539 [Brassica cretica]